MLKPFSSKYIGEDCMVYDVRCCLMSHSFTRNLHHRPKHPKRKLTLTLLSHEPNPEATPVCS